MVHYKLHYFDLRGRGETIRQIFAQAGVEFEDYLINMEEWKSNPQLKSNYLNGQLPVLEVDGKQLAQSYAIARFLAKKFGLAGKDDWEAAMADMYADGVEDVVQKIIPLILARVHGIGNKDELLVKFKAEVLEPFFTKYEKFLNDNGGDYFVGKQLTWADILIAHFFDILTLVDTHMLDDHPALTKFVQHIQSLPNIKKHIDARPERIW